MKKFITVALAVSAVIACLLYGWLSLGLFVHLFPNAQVKVKFVTDEKQICVLEDGAKRPLTIKGVAMSASMPGKYYSDYAATKQDYLRWLGQIQEMGANTVRVYSIMDDDFYNAFYELNQNSDSPLYLIQGIQVPDHANYGSADAYGAEFYGNLISSGKKVVDVIHGRSVIATNKLNGSGLYLRDISPWVLGFLVGSEWSPDTVEYTNHSTTYQRGYQGTYFTVSEEATVFEALLAKVMDNMVTYETSKYGTQRLISFVSDPSVDFLNYDARYVNRLRKYSWIDPENVVPTERLKSGFFASYELTNIRDDFGTYLEESQEAFALEILAREGSDDIFKGYTRVVGEYHTMPLVATGYGVSTARATDLATDQPHTEAEQGEMLVEGYETLLDSHWAGGCIAMWQDTWERKGWNTTFASNPDQIYLWHDLQCVFQNNGLMAFAPGTEESGCIVDGLATEWLEKNKVLENDGYAVYFRSDAEGVHLLITGENLESTPLYLPVDVTDNSGSAAFGEAEITFDRPADFILCLDGTDHTRLLVQQRYNAARENFLEKVTGVNPFAVIPDAAADEFVVSQIAMENPQDMTDELSRNKQLEYFDTGLLRHGNGNPYTADYDSLADFCFGSGLVEVRIPWQLLNFSDPSSMMVHNDYYKYYGVKEMRITEIWLGIGREGAQIQLAPAKLTKWSGGVSYHERLKESYAIVQQAWKGAVG